jgi:uncharacterized protein YkwD
MLLSALILYFIPHTDNNHRAKLLNPVLIAISILTFIATQIGMSFTPSFTPVVLGYVSSISPEQVIDLTNKERLAAGLPELQQNSLLTQAAIKKAQYMFEKNYWAHTAPDGTEPWKFVNDSGYKYRYAGENLARDFATADTAVTAWMDSPSHKDNIMSSRYQDIGVGVMKGELNGVQTTLIVQFFGTKMVNAASVDQTSGPKVAQGATKVAENNAQVQGESKASPIVVSRFSFNKNLAFFFISLFFLIVSIDMIIVGKNQIHRNSSKSFAHLLFFGMIMIAVIAAKAGNIM